MTLKAKNLRSHTHTHTTSLICFSQLRLLRDVWLRRKTLLCVRSCCTELCNDSFRFSFVWGGGGFKIQSRPHEANSMELWIQVCGQGGYSHCQGAPIVMGSFFLFKLRGLLGFAVSTTNLERAPPAACCEHWRSRTRTSWDGVAFFIFR